MPKYITHNFIIKSYIRKKYNILQSQNNNIVMFSYRLLKINFPFKNQIYIENNN